MACALGVVPEARCQDIFGVVTDAETGEPLPGAHVFVAGSLAGTATGTHGRFVLAGLPSGSHRVVASMLGYAPAAVDTMLFSSDLEVNFRLNPRVVPLDGLEVVARTDDRWQKNLERFTREFLGQSRTAGAARIINPEVLDFDRNWWGRLQATASAPLIIENRDLGYRTTYLLKDYDYTPSVLRYDGDPVFEELEPQSREEAEAWAALREQAFRGSFRHFLLALLADSTKEQGFHVYRRPSLNDPNRASMRFPLAPERLLGKADTAGVILRFNGFVEIIYEPELEEPAFLKKMGTFRAPAAQTSWIRLSDGPTLIDWLGTVVDPYGVTVYGYLAFERVGDELPKEYRPPGIHLKTAPPSPD
ncbi:MAG: carboxypeptidase-like regulatory domain-containing protein [Rhodothermales bacterium]|nr:carboxypeptidase-like regulatory domain-containing protein [Rhodothermales bacterium]